MGGVFSIATEFDFEKSRNVISKANMPKWRNLEVSRFPLYISGGYKSIEPSLKRRADREELQSVARRPDQPRNTSFVLASRLPLAGSSNCPHSRKQKPPPTSQPFLCSRRPDPFCGSRSVIVFFVAPCQIKGASPPRQWSCVAATRSASVKTGPWPLNEAPK